MFDWIVDQFENLPLKCLSGTAGVPPANEREARKWTSNDFRKTTRHRRVAGGTPAVPDKHLSKDFKLTHYLRLVFENDPDVQLRYSRSQLKMNPDS